MNILLSTASSLPEGELPVLISVTIGGVLVFVGLAVEKFADWMNDRYLGGVEKPHRPLETVGWCILMLGIFMEIAVAGWSANDAWQTRQMAVKNNPLNLPLSDLTADVSIRIKGVPDDSPSPFRMTMANMEFFSQDIHEGVSLSDFCVLVAYKSDFQITIWEDPKSHTQSKQYLLHFHKMDAVDVGLEYSISHPLPGVLIGRPVVRDVMEKVVNVEIDTWFIPHDAEIEGGAITLLANGSIPKYFVIPQQKAFPPPRGLGWSAQNPGFTLFATNSLTPFSTRMGVWP